MKEIEEDTKWKAEEDARTLMEYQKLIKDKKRMTKAEMILKEKQDEVSMALKSYKDKKSTSK